MKAYAVASGRIQGVGYRFFVLRQARQSGIRGFVRNLPGGNVEIYAVHEDPARLDDFFKAIDQKSSSSFFGIHVEGISVSYEGKRGFCDFGEPESFDIRF